MPALPGKIRQARRFDNMVCKILKKSRGIFGEIAIFCEKFIGFVSKACNLSHNDVKYT